jgi:hypothetical protein
LRTVSAKVFFIILPALASGQSQLVVDDPLTNGVTVGIRDNGGGEFVGGGWMVTGASDNIRYTPPNPLEAGALEFDVRGLRFDDTREQNHRGQLLSMYDASFGDPRHVYAPDMRLNPFKFVLQRNGRDKEAYFANHLKLIMNTDGVNQFEDYSAAGAFAWDENRTYRMRLEWKAGIIRFSIDGQDLDRWPFVYRSVYRPAIHDIRIGTNTRNNAILGAVYSNVKIYDFGAPPPAPVIHQPAPTATTLAPVIDWTGVRHSHYEARVTTSTEPSADVVWSSGPVASAESYAVSGPLPDRTAFFAHVRLGNDRGWGEWSAPRPFTTRADELPVVAAYTEHEIVLLSSRARANPYTDVRLSATFDGPTTSLRVNGFWDGGTLYKLRVLPTEVGVWNWRTSSNDPDLDGRSGTFVSEASGAKAFVRVSPARPYGFEWAGTEEPFFLLGDTLWHMYYNLPLSDGSFQSLIDDRAAQHFNYAHGVVHDFLSNEGGPIYRRQDPARETFDTDWLNPHYFRILDDKIDYMNARGMVAALFFSWGNEGYQEYEDPSQYQRYIRYLVSRYASKNVFWILVGEFEEAGEPRSRWQDYARTVAEADPYGHPTSIHTVATTDVFGPDAEHSFISHQRKGSPEELRELVAESRIFEKPVINLEYGYEGDPQQFPTNQPPEDVRRDHYAITLAGGFGVYGNHTPWYSTYHRVGDFVLTATDTPAAGYLSILYEFFTGTAFQRLEPAQDLVDRGIAAAWRGNEYVVQLPSGGAVVLDLRGATGSFLADWFDPRTGERRPIGTVLSGTAPRFDAPSNDDWILHLYRFPIGGGGTARIDMGAVNLQEGLFSVEPPDGTTTPSNAGGRDARTNADPSSDFYFYFAVEDTFHFQGGHAETFITVHYLDAGAGALALQYDASDGNRYKNGGTVSLGNGGAWQSHIFRLTDAYFGNRQNAGADFRIFGAGGHFYIDRVEVTHDGDSPPSPASRPEPANDARGVALEPVLSWTSGAGAAFHDVHFSTTNPPAFRGRQSQASFAPGVLAPNTTYFWRVDEGNERGVTEGALWRFTTGDGASVATLEIPATAGVVRIDGNPEDWNLDARTRTVPAGEVSAGDVALVGYDEGVLYVSGYATHLSLPESERDHTARVYALHDADSLYFLVRVSDDDSRSPFDTAMNWANDCVEIYIDPEGNGGLNRLQESTSDVQLVVDVQNRVNVYATTAGYRQRVLANVLTATRVDAEGWWAEIRLLKSGLAPAIPLDGAFGVDFNFRDNDADNAPSETSVATWSDFERSANFPSKIPDRWGRGLLIQLGNGERPSVPESPSPAHGAGGVTEHPRLAWQGGAGASAFDVFFGTSSPPPFASRTSVLAFDPGILEPDTTYFWRVDAVNTSGTTGGPVWRFTTGAEVLAPTLSVSPASAIVVDGDPGDWNLGELTSLVRAGDVVEGDVALVGWDGGSLYWAGRFTGAGLPRSASDHTARVYARHDATYLYFLASIQDDDLQTGHGLTMNWANDSLEIYIDPSGDGGGEPLSSSSSDVQLVVDAANRRNVYVATDAYRSQLIGGVVSAVVRHAAGWFCEIRIEKRSLDPDLPASGSFGLDFNFRDNDRANDPAETSVTSWSDREQSGQFPSKIPNRWGRARLRN